MCNRNKKELNLENSIRRNKYNCIATSLASSAQGKRRMMINLPKRLQVYFEIIQ
jgi:hypothetical protein